MKISLLKTIFIKIKRLVKVLAVVFIIFILVGTFFINISGVGKQFQMPVQNANVGSWDKSSFWHPNWGHSVFHKGIDIFAERNTLITSPVNGIVLFSGYSENGGNYIYIFDSKFRIYYFAHLNNRALRSLKLVKQGHRIGLVGNSGNAISKPCHLHFSIFSLLPIFKYYSSDAQGWKKMFYLNPSLLIKLK